MNNLTTKISCFLIATVVIFSLFNFAPENANAVSNQKWVNITPTQSNVTPPLRSYDGMYSYYASVAEVLETKPDGTEVYHLFLANSGYYYYYLQQPSYGGPLVLHSANDGESWNKIIPPQWKHGLPPDYWLQGGHQISLKVIPHEWTDANGSKWSGKVFLYCNSGTPQPIQSGQRMYRPSVYRYDGDGSGADWIPLAKAIPGYGTGGGYTTYMPYYYLGHKAHFEYFEGSLYILTYQYLGLLGSPPAGGMSQYAGFKIVLLKYNSDLFAATPLTEDNGAWIKTWESPIYAAYTSFYCPKYAFTLKTIEDKANGRNYLILSTQSTSRTEYAQRWYSSEDYYPYYQGFAGGMFYISKDGSTFNQFSIPYNSNSTYLPGSPLSVEVFKGYLYAGFGTHTSDRTRGYLYRLKLENLENSLTIGDNLSLRQYWENCGRIDPRYETGSYYYGIMALGKSYTRVGDTTVEHKLIFGGQYYYVSPPGKYWNPLWSTEGGDTVPLSFKVEEDEWTGYMYIYQIYDIYPYSKGTLVTFFNSQYMSQYGYRYYHVMFAPPFADINYTPKPVVNERGTYSQIIFTVLPIGAFGWKDVRVRIELPENIFLPYKDAGGAPVNEEFYAPSIPFTNQLTAVIKTSLATRVGMYNCKFIITDLNFNVTVEITFIIQVRPPKSGFSTLITPSYTTVSQGECQKFSVDITTRNNFDKNVIIDITWLTAPPSNDITFNWDRSSLIYDYISDKSVGARTRKNIGTRYFFSACTTDDTTLGTFQFRVTFVGGGIFDYQDVTFIVVRPPAAFSIISVPATEKVVPGGSAAYRIKIESRNGYIGFVALSLQDIPLHADIVDFKAENPPPGHLDNYVELTLSQPVAWVILEVKTYATYRDTGGNLIQGTPSGLHYIRVVGEGQGFDPDGNTVTPTVYGIAGLQVFQQIEDMKTPSFTFWGMILILIGIFGVVVSLLKKKKIESNS